MLDRVLEGMADVVGYKAGVKGLELVLDVAPDVPPHLVGDALRLGQILINFANNAIKFTERGEIHVRVRVVERHGRRVLLRFEVRDTGIGVAPEQMGRLFQSFQQADASTTRRFGGSGLGLAISKNLAELMGGEVGAESVLGEGSTFWVMLPLECVEGALAAPPLPPALRNGRVLIVDDNHTAAAVLSEMLRSMGFETRESHAGAQALDMLRDAAADGEPLRAAAHRLAHAGHGWHRAGPAHPRAGPGPGTADAHGHGLRPRRDHAGRAGAGASRRCWSSR